MSPTTARWAGLALSATAILGACGSGPSPAPTPTLVSLPVTATGPGGPCAGEAHPGPLFLEADASGVFANDGRHRFVIRWPAGFHAVFDPVFVAVVEDTGRVFARASQDINLSETIDGYLICYQGLFGIDIFREMAEGPI